METPSFVSAIRAKASTPRVVVGVYAVLVIAALSSNAAHSWFWQRKHDMAPVAATCLIALLVALVFKRRWAWVLLGLADLGAVMSIPFPPRASLLADAWALVSLALIVSPPMRAHVRPIREVPYWRTRTTFRDGSFRTK